MDSIERELRTFIVENFLFGEERPLASDDSFLESGMIDSTGMLSLISFLEERYGFSIETEELVPENLDSINRLLRFIERKTQKKVGAAREA